MSTTRIFLIFGLIVAIIVIPLSVLYFSFQSILGSFKGLAESAIVGMIGAFIVALTLDFTIARRQEKAAENISKVGLTEASQAINRLLALIGSMIKASSNGYIPSNIDELFNTNSQDLISLHLDLKKKAPVAPASITWSQYIGMDAKYVFDNLTSINQRYQLFFSPKIYIALNNIRNSHFIHILNMITSLTEVSGFDIGQGIERNVMNIPLESLNSLMTSLLNDIKIVEKESIRLKSDVIVHFPRSTFQTNVFPKIGEARYEGTPGPGLYIGPELPSNVSNTD